MAKGNRGGKRAGASSGNSEPVVFAGKTKSQIESDIMDFTKYQLNVPLTGTQADIAQGTKERNALGKLMVKYAFSRMSDGRSISAQRVNQYTNGTKSDIADNVIQNAKSHTRNSSFEVSNLNGEIKIQNDLIQRNDRLADIFTKHTNAKFWVGKHNGYILGQMEDYVDGKINKIYWG